MVNVFKNRNFSFLFIGRLITNLGDSIYAIAAMWLVFNLTNDPFYTGLASAIVFIPQLFGFIFGPLVDRLSLKFTLIITQVMEGLLILCVPVASYFNVLNVWIVIIVMFLASVFSEISYPAQSSILPRILKEEDLVHGNSLMSFAYQGIDFALTAVSGLLLVYIGVINIYIVDSITFILAGIMFLNINIKNNQKTDDKKSKAGLKEIISNYKKDLKVGLNFVKNSFIPKLLIPLVIANGLFGMINAILPAFSISKGGDEYYGYYMAAWSVGMLLGSLIAPLFQKFPIGRVIILSTFISFIIWFVSFLSNPVLSLILFGIANVTLGIVNVLIFTMFQTLIPEELLGRVFAVISSISSIALPFGSILGGFLGSIIDSSYVYLMGAISLLFVSVYWIVYPKLRNLPSYNKMNKENYIFFEKGQEISQ
ncbi:MFS transporter [Radiobacillus deserti]|uniref:MFS transporter n=1 Tax=Radiobacillus deserti TaxID=2594883 RepID=A0A516KDP2_9BACI|nr:MFS transporter [Radiobacillus deserti]QDP39487.1 MFS transporter [Radiobacillus deserti]